MQDTPHEQPVTVTTARPWPPPQGEWTYEAWLQLPDDGNCYEVIDGVLYVSPPPLIRHQRISVRLIGHLLDFLKQHPVGEVLFAPVGVRLPNQPVPLQPDIVLVRAERLEIIGEAYVEGPPDVLMEILSPSNWRYDRREKQQVYQDAGVTEYWIVDPRATTIEAYVLEQGGYVLAGQYRPGDVAPSRVIPGFAVPVEDIFTP